jgi:hypothetical protein
MLEKQNGELQGLVMHLTNENHALRMSMQQQTGGALMTPMIVPVYPASMYPTPKLPLPMINAPVSAPPSPQSELRKPEAKRRKKTVAASVTALALGALSVVGLISPGGQRNSTTLAKSHVNRRLLALSGPSAEENVSNALMHFNISSLREEIARRDEVSVLQLPDKASDVGIMLWGDTTLDGKAVDVMHAQTIDDPWYSAFRDSGMLQHINLLSRVSCTEVFKFQSADVSEAVKMTKGWEEPAREQPEFKKFIGAIPMPSGSENVSSIPNNIDMGTEESLVSVLLPPPNPTEGVIQQLSKLFVVTFNKRTAAYTTHSCLMPQPSPTENHL